MLRSLSLLCFVNSACLLLEGCSASVAVPKDQQPAPAASAAPGSAALEPNLANITFPGDPEFVRVARDVVDVTFALDPSSAANNGLFDDALRVPSFAPQNLGLMLQRLDQDLAALRSMAWRTWPVDRQMDFRWVFAWAETVRRQLVSERLFVRRPAAWLESVSNALIAFTTYIPNDQARPERLWTQVPTMLKEMRGVCTDITRRDQEIAIKLTKALTGMAISHGTPAGKLAAQELGSYEAELVALKPSKDFGVVGSENFEWRLKHSLLLAQSGKDLVAAAQQERARIDQELAVLDPKLEPLPEPSAAQQARAASLSRESMLALYDGIENELRAATLAGNFVTIPAGVGPIHCRETPAAMVPLTGDGGSMNPPPPFVKTDVAYWNVQNFNPNWPAETRIKTIMMGDGWRNTFMGAYAAHEGYPGHHLQLAIARLNPNPLRSMLPDAVQNEGWGLYAEEELWSHGGLGPSVRSKASVLRSTRFRASRVVYDVNIETGVWDLQQGADFKDGAAPGKGEIDEDVMRAIQWPTQLLSYFTGKLQIAALKAEYKQKLGAAYTDRAFHDAFLAEGSIPITLIRAKLLGAPVPDL